MITQPSFDLVDHHGRSVTLESFRGRRCLVFFGFTHCEVVCPRALAKLTNALDRAGQACQDVQGLYISVDPERDTPQRLEQFLQPHPRFLGLTGTPDQCANARDAFGVFVRRRSDPGTPAGYDLPHSALTYLLGPEGEYLDHWLDSASEEEISAGLRTSQGERAHPWLPVLGGRDNANHDNANHCCHTDMTTDPASPVSLTQRPEPKRPA